jgi:molecular chaperone Hsp33
MSQEDVLLTAITNDGFVRAYAVKATGVVEEAQARHETWSSSTVALGRTLIAGLLLGANQKGEDKITVKVQGNGAGGDIIVDANTHGEVKGYISNPKVDYKKTSTGEVIVNLATGSTGMFTVIKDMGLKEPYAGQVPFVTGEIGEELTYYLTESEQTPSAAGVSVGLDADDRAHVAGGFIVQLLPDATEEAISKLEANLQKLPAIADILDGGTPVDLLDGIFGKGEYKVLEETPVAFKCDCSKDRFGAAIITLGQGEIQAMIDEDHGAEAVCQFCNTKYQFTVEDLQGLLEEATH